jgi:hypothetical protein
MKRLSLCAIVATATILVGCESETAYVDSQMGKSVAQLVQAQTLNTRTAANPPPYAPDGADGQRLKNVLDAQRKDVPRGQEHVSQALVFEVGKQTQ